MEKPIKKVQKAVYDYSECNDYIENKYNIKTRDYAGLFGPSYALRNESVCKELGIDYNDLKEDLSGLDKNDPEVKRKLANRDKVDEGVKKIEPEYQDFWHWIIDTQPVSNGGIIILSADMAEEGTWQKKILDLFMEEYGEPNQEGILEAEFNTWW